MLKIFFEKMLQKNLTFSRTRRGVQESLHPFLYRSIIKGCTGLQLEIDKNVYVII